MAQTINQFKKQFNYFEHLKEEIALARLSDNKNSCFEINDILIRKSPDFKKKQLDEICILYKELLKENQKINNSFQLALEIFFITALERSASKEVVQIYFDFFQDPNFYIDYKHNKHHVGVTASTMVNSKENLELLLEHGANYFLLTKDVSKPFIDKYGIDKIKKWTRNSEEGEKITKKDKLVPENYEVKYSFWERIRKFKPNMNMLDYIVAMKHQKMVDLISQQTKKEVGELNVKDLEKFEDKSFLNLSLSEKEKSQKLFLNLVLKNTAEIVNNPQRYTEVILYANLFHGKNIIAFSIEKNKLEFVENCFKKIDVPKNYVSKAKFGYFEYATSGRKISAIDLILKYNMLNPQKEDAYYTVCLLNHYLIAKAAQLTVYGKLKKITIEDYQRLHQNGQSAEYIMETFENHCRKFERKFLKKEYVETNVTVKKIKML